MGMKKLCIVLAVSVIAGNASAIINVDLGDIESYNTFSGQGVYADPGNDTWNVFGATGWDDITTGPLLGSDGTVTGVSMTVSAGGNWRYGNSNAMLKDYAFTSMGDRDVRTIRISGLAAGSEYTLYLYGAGDVWDQGTAFTFGGNTAHTTGYTGSGYVPGANYVVMSATADGFGNIAGSWTNSTLTASYNQYGAFNGIQIVPEPATLVLFGLGGVLIRRRRA